MTEPSSPDNEPRPWWRWFNVTGLDAVVVALVWMPLFAIATGAKTPRPQLVAELIVLGCAVWCVYIADRILDGSMAAGRRGERHQFARRHRWKLLAAVAVAAVGCTLLLGFNIAEIVSVWGLRLLAAVAVYFCITWLSRREWPGMTGAGALCCLIAIGLMQGVAADEVWPHVWRGAIAGILITVLIFSVTRSGTPPPWTLPRKLLGGWLFALGTALAPHANMEAPRDLLTGNPVLLFGTICGLNSLGIRIWETKDTSLEDALLAALYPWMLVVAAAGAAMEWAAADSYSRPLLMACGLAASCLLILHLLRRRFSTPALRALADALMALSAAAMLIAGRR